MGSDAIDRNLLVRSKRGRRVKKCGDRPADATGWTEYVRSGNHGRHRMGRGFVGGKSLGFDRYGNSGQRGFILRAGLIPEVGLFCECDTAEAKPDSEQSPGTPC